MPKLKTHSGSKKRFNLTKSGKVKVAKAFKSHILTKKPTKRTRRLRQGGYADKTTASTIRKMIPYKEFTTIRFKEAYTIWHVLKAR